MRFSRTLPIVALLAAGISFGIALRRSRPVPDLPIDNERSSPMVPAQSARMDIHLPDDTPVPGEDFGPGHSELRQKFAEAMLVAAFKNVHQQALILEVKTSWFEEEMEYRTTISFRREPDSEIETITGASKMSSDGHAPPSGSRGPTALDSLAI